MAASVGARLNYYLNFDAFGGLDFLFQNSPILHWEVLELMLNCSEFVVGKLQNSLNIEIW
jgi:hypothetical protein